MPRRIGFLSRHAWWRPHSQLVSATTRLYPQLLTDAHSMHYTDDSCRDHFTSEQIERMIAFWKIYREEYPVNDEPAFAQCAGLTFDFLPCVDGLRCCFAEEACIVCDDPTSSTFEPTLDATTEPTLGATIVSTSVSSGEPTAAHSTVPSVASSDSPSAAPITDEPSSTPSGSPTDNLSSSPSGSPTAEPSLSPSGFPTSEPTTPPSVSPSSAPTELLCSQCRGNTAGPCRQFNSVCHKMVHGFCPAGTTPCTEEGNAALDAAVEALVQCTDCYAGTSGTCRQGNGVCWNANAGICPPGTFACTKDNQKSAKTPKKCRGCWPGTSGPCQQSNSVCHQLLNGSCPAGTTMCQ